MPDAEDLDRYPVTSNSSESQFAGTALGIFAKWPEPGLVKTRLAAATSPEWAARVANAFLRDLCDRFSGCATNRFLVFSPAAAAARFGSVAAGRFQLVAQGDGDLGARIQRFLSDRLASGATRVVIVGTDSPSLPLALVERAYDALREANVVLGPAADGGYYLLGCRDEVPPVFDGVDWSSSRVLNQTVDRLADPHWRLAVLPPWYDVDDLDGWRCLVGHLAALRRAGEPSDLPRTEILTCESGIY